MRRSGEWCRSYRAAPRTTRHDRRSGWERLERDLADLRERSHQLHSRWQTEKEAITALQSVKEQIEQTRLEIERAERAADLEKVARLRYGGCASWKPSWRRVKSALKGCTKTRHY
jgi:ATP-dependent Clp protease ATP-binding subunit ClpB